MAFLPIRKVPVEQQRKVKLMRYVTSALSIMTVFLLEMFQRTNQSQESTCLTMLHNECCVGYWKAGNINVHVR